MAINYAHALILFIATLIRFIPQSVKMETRGAYSPRKVAMP